MIKIQSMKINFNNNLIYSKPSKIWNIDENKLFKFEYFQKLFSMNSDYNVFLINDISDEEMEIFIKYIDNNNMNLNEINIDDIMLLIKISDYLLITDLFEKVQKEFLSRL
tara:strand:- start:235 stop:564 length:330 start_codon:yes stop_codon:yes gene_type:complete